MLARRTPQSIGLVRGRRTHHSGAGGIGGEQDSTSVGQLLAPRLRQNRLRRFGNLLAQLRQLGNDTVVSLRQIDERLLKSRTAEVAGEGVVVAGRDGVEFVVVA